MSLSAGPLSGFPHQTPVSHDMSGFMPRLGRMSGNERASTNFGDLGGPSVRSAYVDGATNYYDSGAQNTNGFQTHHMSVTLGNEWQEGDTVRGMPTFLKGPASMVGMIPALTSYRAMSLPMLGQRLHYDPQWRKLYGEHLSIQPFLSEWRDIGFQQTLELKRVNNCYNTECNFIIGGRMRVPNVWHANCNAAVPQIALGAQLYYIFTRHEYKGSRVMNKATWNSSSREDAPSYLDSVGMDEDDEEEDIDNDPELVAEREAAYGNVGVDATLIQKKQADFDADLNNALMGEMTNKGTAPIASLQGRVAKVEAIKAKHVPAVKKEYYWSIDPWVSLDGMDPHPSLWTGSTLDPDNNYCGDYRYVGIVTHTLGGSDNSCNGIDRATAREALYPKTRGLEYHSAYFKLPCIEIMVGAKRSHTVSC